MIAFPAYIPSSRALTYGKFPVKKFTTYSGGVISRIYGDSLSGFILPVTFGNVGGLPDLETNAIYNMWLASLGEITPVILPDEIWAGDLALKDTIPDYIEWYFSSEDPRIEPTVPGYSRISLTFIGRLPGE